MSDLMKLHSTSTRLDGQGLEPSRQTDALNLAAQLGGAVADCDQSARDVRSILDDTRLHGRVRDRAQRDLVDIGAAMLRSEVTRVSTAPPLRTAPIRPHLRSAGGEALQSLWRQFDGFVTDIARQLRQRANRRLAARWTALGLTFTAAAAGLLVVNRPVLALCLVVFRLVGSALAGGPAVVSHMTSVTIETTPSLARSLVACLASHLSDMMLLVAAAAVLYRDGRPGWALMLAIGGVIAMYGTMARVAAERTGMRISRSPVERVVRNGSLLAALGGTAALEPASLLPFPPLVLLALGTAGYGLIEVVMITMRLLNEPVPVRAVTVSVDSNDEVRLWTVTVNGLPGPCNRRGFSPA